MTTAQLSLATAVVGMGAGVRGGGQEAMVLYGPFALRTQADSTQSTNGEESFN